jgi:hypothetical protein
MQSHYFLPDPPARAASFAGFLIPSFGRRREKRSEGSARSAATRTSTTATTTGACGSEQAGIYDTSQGNSHGNITTSHTIACARRCYRTDLQALAASVRTHVSSHSGCVLSHPSYAPECTSPEPCLCPILDEDFDSSLAYRDEKCLIHRNT